MRGCKSCSNYITGIHGTRDHRKKLQYWVSWLGYQEKTWEWAGNIPLFIRNYYHQCGKKETLLPPPRLEPANLGKDSYYYLTWEGSDVPGTYVKASDLVYCIIRVFSIQTHS